MNKKQIVISIATILSITMFVGTKDLNKYADAKNTQKIDQDINQDDVESNLILVNKENPLKSNYKPKNMVKCNIPFIDGSIAEEKYLDEDAAKAIEQLFITAKGEGIEFLGTSGYRSYETQKNIFKKNINSRGIKEASKYAAKPGKSEHQTGLAIDVTNQERWFHKTTKEAMWLADNAHRFGFILRFLEGKEHITGYNFEPWHVRYVGKEVAKEIYDKGITLEEYIQNK